MIRASHRFAVGALLATAAAGGYSLSISAQRRGAAAAPQRLTIPYLGNATKPSDLDYAAAECDIEPSGDRMTCAIHQVFLTVSGIDAAACVITTNGYDRRFRREAPTQWVSETAPEGACGIVETTRLEDGGGTHWTMTVSEAATAAAGGPQCRDAVKPADVYDWRLMKRRLPCTSIQPGAIER